MAKTVEIGPAEISKALADANFFQLVPEFAPLRVKMETMKANSKRGCTSCRMRHIIGSINADFMHILPTLSDDGFSRLKKYYGADNIRYNKVDIVARKTLVITV